MGLHMLHFPGYHTLSICSSRKRNGLRIFSKEWFSKITIRSIKTIAKKSEICQILHKKDTNPSTKYVPKLQILALMISKKL